MNIFLYNYNFVDGLGLLLLLLLGFGVVHRCGGGDGLGLGLLLLLLLGFGVVHLCGGGDGLGLGLVLLLLLGFSVVHRCSGGDDLLLQRFLQRFALTTELTHDFLYLVADTHVAVVLLDGSAANQTLCSYWAKSQPIAIKVYSLFFI